MDIEGLIKGIFLLILAVSGNFVAETLGCKSQKLLTENIKLPSSSSAMGPV